ncbi:dicarboxylate transporter/tellurite-resistance protein TehA [Sinorhizobium meliloti]|uniref:Dicarboxylate transporter/tellurite-resistance protein TehA n=1 Tax=Rhizobium meliloti TaxID=382 RepID=A0A2J0YT37_RHIML|nr:dicarboxylate transporter/tellurite-resistance protein TehA [Sinorhizobium meliloti]PJR08767.1 dicarboxylate transporter/tellurite-resistance protein TehA [Sinorhizobium meliloti]
MDTMLKTQRLAEHTPGPFAQIVGNMPASYFGMVLGLAGLGNAWRGASLAWQLPEFIAEWIYVVAGAVWAVLVVLYILKAILAPAKLMEEAAHPVQCCFIGLAGVSTMLIAGGLVPHSQLGASIVFAIAFIFTLLFAVWRTGGLWKGERDHANTTAVLYLPTVAGSFVSATVVSALGYPDWGQFAFGAGLFSWLAIESVLLHRLLIGPTNPAPLRPTLGVQLAPAPVGAVAYIAISGGVPDIFAHALIGYGILQLLVMARLSRWIAQAGAVPGLWAFSFGATAIAAAPALLIAHGDHGAISILAPLLFVIANLVIAGLIVMTLSLLLSGKMFASPQSKEIRREVSAAGRQC